MKKYKKIDEYIDNGWADFPEGRVTDRMVYEFVKEHSTIWDRLNSKKMFYMTIISQAMLYPEYLPQPKKKDWRFFKDY